MENKENTQKELVYELLGDIELDGKLDTTINFKPTTAPIICIVIGVVLLIPNILLVRLLGMFFIGMAVLVIYTVKDKKVADIYDNGVLIYNPKKEGYAFFLKYKDVKMWKVDHSEGHDAIIFTLHNSYRTGFDSFQANKAFNAINKYIPEKEERVIQQERIRSKPSTLIDNIKRKLGIKK